MTSYRLQALERLVAAGDLKAAAPLAQAALAEGEEGVLVLNLAAHGLELQGRNGEAAALLQRALRLDPADTGLMTSLGLCFARLERWADARSAFEAALRIDPRSAGALCGLGDCLLRLGRLDDARFLYQRAAELEPDYAEPLAALAGMAMRSGEPDQARALADQALVIAPGHPAAANLRVGLHLAAGDFDQAQQGAEALLAAPDLPPSARGAAGCLLGDALHGQRRFAPAFVAYEAAATAFRSAYAEVYERRGADGLIARLHGLSNRFAGLPHPWTRSAPGERAADEPQDPVFLVGFHRSGTTLLESVLAGHPDLVCLEEKPTLVDAEAAFLSGAGGLERLADLDDEGARRWRDIYWRRVAEFGIAPDGRRLVDKLPFNTVNLPLIARLFPEAQVLFAVRDPRDVVLSCFRRGFRPNPASFQMLSLQGAAALYDAVMRLAVAYRAALPLALHEVRYEAFVADLRGETARILNFLGLEWSEQALDFAANARGRPISTPSAAQVRRGLYRDGQGQWLNYADQMAPVLEILAPWVDRYGYAGD